MNKMVKGRQEGGCEGKIPRPQSAQKKPQCKKKGGGSYYFEKG